ncbi:MAG: ABC transporter substrate-binding protein [Deltaproteobacteria bacterium]|nr:ABC transporter substrate-binding protein [Deltaproteobacteria bacterium]MBI3076293.1 ABC transporter substrate-binding protein [Deltaproteobacteria bacterium]
MRHDGAQGKMAAWTILLLTVLFLGPTAAAAATKEETLTVGLYQDFFSMDPHGGIISDWTSIRGNTYEPLVDLDDQNQVKPVLATSWRISPDGRTYTFSLRRGVRFSDGTPFDAQAMKFSVERLMTLKKGPYVYAKMIRRVETPDSHTIVFHLDKPYSAFLRGLRLVFAVSPKAVKEHEVRGDSAQGWLNEHSAGTGPYKVVEWKRGITLTWGKNDHYWGGWTGSHFTTVHLRMIYDSSAQRLMLEKGELDVAQNVTTDDVPALKRNPQITVYENVGAGGSFLYMTAAGGPTKDVLVRRAISLAWNHKAYEAIRRGLAPRGSGPTPELILGNRYNLDEIYPYDLGKARALLAQAGYPNGGFTLRFLTQKGDEQKRMQYEVLQGELRKLNVRTELIEETWPAMNKRLADWERSRDPATAVHLIAVWTPATIFHPWEWLYFRYHTDATLGKGGRNIGLYSNPRLDRLMEEALTTVDPKKEQQLWVQANELALQEAPSLAMDRIVDIVAMRKEIKGYVYQQNRTAFAYYRMSRAR